MANKLTIVREDASRHNRLKRIRWAVEGLLERRRPRGARARLELSEEELWDLHEALKFAAEYPSYRAEWLRQRARIAEARHVLRETDSAAAALRVLGVTKGDANKGRRYDGRRVAELYVRLQEQPLTSVSWAHPKAALKLADALEESLRTGEPGPAVDTTDLQLRRVEFTKHGPLSPADALREVARAFGFPDARAAWRCLSAENSARQARGEPRLFLPPRPR